MIWQVCRTFTPLLYCVKIMKVSLQWLNQYLHYPVSAEEAADILTRTGLEVEDIVTYQSIPGGLQGLVIGKVMEKHKHPNADRLSVTQVDIGQSEWVQIVCGAPNVEAGQTVIVATVGTRLHSKNGLIEIKKANIRGVESQGMICAEDEIGIGNSHDGIIVIPQPIAPGTLAASYYQVYSDTVLELNITPNRVDATSHIGVARDISAYHSIHATPNPLQTPTLSSATPTLNQQSVIPVSLINPEACPRYAGAYLRQIKIEPSPMWLQHKLNSIGLKPINNLVDITNYVLFETGHPLHAFDVSFIKDKQLIVRLAHDKEKLTTLDGVERTLSNCDLVICDTEKPLCLAGIYGGIGSGVSESTTEVFIESACFSPSYIRRSSKNHNLHTDASFRFERGADISQVPYALQRAIDLIIEITGAVWDRTMVDILPQPIQPNTILLRTQYLHQIAGIEIPANIAIQILTSLGFEIIHADDNEIKVHVPTSKVDVTREIDLVEEIMRIYGYDKITLRNTLSAVLKNEPEKPSRHYKNKIAQMLVNNGYYETITLSLDHSIHYPSSFPELITVENPISSELDVMRHSLLFTMLKSAAHNLNRKNNRLHLFEFGRRYYKTDKHPYNENHVLGILICGEEHLDSWFAPIIKSDFHSIQGVCETILNTLSIPYQPVSQIQTPDYRFESAFACYSKEKNPRLLYTCGKVSGTALKKTDIKQEIWFAELYWDQILIGIPSSYPVFKELPKFPIVVRDLAILIDNHIGYRDIKNIAGKTFGDKLLDILLFDVYEGRNIPQGKKSYAVRFSLYNNEKTFTDKEVDDLMQKLISNLSEQTGAEIRANAS